MFEGGQNSGIVSRQDCTEFEDALRRLYALENKLTEQVCPKFGQDCNILCDMFFLSKGVEEHRYKYIWSFCPLSV